MAPKKAVINDINEKLVQFYCELQTKPTIVREQLDNGKLNSIYQTQYAQLWMLSLNHIESLYLQKQLTTPEAFQ